MSSVDDTLNNLRNFFDERIKAHGAQPKGVDWNSQESQVIRFEQLLKIVQQPDEPFSIIDFGCGYGALIDYLNAKGYQYTYTGYDMTPAVIEAASQAYASVAQATFTHDLNAVQPADYIVGSGLFNMKMDTSDDSWTQHMYNTLNQMWYLCNKGMAFNSLTSYSDAEYMRPDLFYPNPMVVFDYCKRNYARNVALLHDYNLYDFTVLVRRDRD